jgi:hypothetical protein
MRTVLFFVLKQGSENCLENPPLHNLPHPRGEEMEKGPDSLSLLKEETGMHFDNSPPLEGGDWEEGILIGRRWPAVPWEVNNDKNE